MEDWQRVAINDNLPELFRITNVNMIMLSILSPHLSSEDMQALEASPKPFDRASILYAILKTRPGGFEAILEALKQTNQSRAASILERAQNKYSKSVLKKSPNILIWSTSNVETTVSKFTEYGTHKKIFVKLTEPISERRNPWKILKRSLKDILRPTPKMSFKLLLIPQSNNEINPQTTQSLVSYLNCKAISKLERYSKIIIVTPLSTKEITENIFSSLNDEMKSQVQGLQDPPNWTDLPTSFQEIILSQLVYDQGKLVSLKDFCDTYVYADQDQFHRNILSGDLLVDLIVYPYSPVIFRQTIFPFPENAYISRRLRSRSCIGVSILQERSERNVIAVSGFEDMVDLKRYAKISNGKFDTAENQPETRIVANFILVRVDSAFKTLLGKREGKSIHWLHHENGKLFWKITYGDLSHIQLHVHSLEQKVIPERNLYSNTNTPSNDALILCDSAGMGKSVSLAKIARETQKNTDGTQMVFFLVLTDFITAVKKRLTSKGASNLKDAILSELMSQASEYDLQAELFGQSKNSHATFCLFFDGLDEVSIDLHEFSIDCLAIIKSQFKNTRLHVTTRPQLLEKLEERLKVLAFNIEPFDRDDQINFLTQLWSNDRIVKGQSVNKTMLHQFITDCLNFLNKILSKAEIDIAGVPLQCLLIGEAFNEDGKQYADPETKQTNIILGFKITCLTDLYGRIICKKYQRIPNADEWSLNCLHFYFAIQTIFAGTDWAEKLRSTILSKDVYRRLLKMFPECCLTESDFQKGKLPCQELSRLGVLQQFSDENYQFVHRTYAEYFIAKCIIKLISKNPSSDPCQNATVSSFVDTAVLQTNSQNVIFSKYFNISRSIQCFKHSVICLFLNALLHSTDISNYHDFAVSSSSLKKVVIASVLENFTNIFQIYKPTTDHMEDSDWTTTVLFCAVQSSSPAAEQIFDHFAHESEGLLEQLLGITAEQGNLEMMIHINTRKGTLDSWNASQKQSIINACVSCTQEIDEDVINKKRTIFEFIANENEAKTYLLQNFIEDDAPLFQHGVHIELLKSMIEQVQPDDLKKSNGKGNKTVLHKTAEYLSSDHYDELLKFLDKHQHEALSKLAAYRDKAGQTPIHTVIKHMEPSAYAVELLLKKKLTRNQVDDTNYNVTWLALKYNRSLECLKEILRLSQLYEGKCCDKFGRSPLHIAAKYAKDERVLQLLLNDICGINQHDIGDINQTHQCCENHPDNCGINQPDNFGNTPLFYALCNPDHHIVIDFLHKHHANFNHQNGHGTTVFHFIAETANIEVLIHFERLIRSSESSRVTDNDGNTVLHYAMRCQTGDTLGMVSHLLKEYTSLIETKNKRGESALNYALSRKHFGLEFDAVELLVSKMKPHCIILSENLHANFIKQFSNLSADEQNRYKHIQNLLKLKEERQTPKKMKFDEHL